MTDLVIKFRDPFYPHSEIASVRPAGIPRYGQLLHRAGTATFRVSRSDTNQSDAFALGAYVTIERGDELFPFAGYITERVLDARSAEVQFVAQDLAGSLFAMGITPKHWSERDASSGQVIRDVFGDAMQRAEPPITIDLPSTEGPKIAFTPRTETLLAFLRTMERFTDWEWGLRPNVTSESVITSLLWQERLGRDYSSEFILESGVHVQGLKLTQHVEGFIQRGIAVGGSGTFAGRFAESVSVDGSGFQGAESQALGAPDPPSPRSPAMSGTRVVVDSQVTNRPALAAAARRLHSPEEHVREQLDFELVESRVDLNLISLGSTYRLRYADLAFDRDVERRFRIQALAFSTEGVINVVAAIERESEVR